MTALVEEEEAPMPDVAAEFTEEVRFYFSVTTDYISAPILKNISGASTSPPTSHHHSRQSPSSSFSGNHRTPTLKIQHLISDFKIITNHIVQVVKIRSKDPFLGSLKDVAGYSELRGELGSLTKLDSVWSLGFEAALLGSEENTTILTFIKIKHFVWEELGWSWVQQKCTS